MGTAKEKHHRQGKIGNRPLWVLGLAILLRAVHQIGAALFLAASLFGDHLPLSPAIVLLASVSGSILLVLEWMRHREIYREVSGIATFVKLILLGLAFHAFLPQAQAVAAAFILASIIAHAPKQYRHRLLY